MKDKYNELIHLRIYLHEDYTYEYKKVKFIGELHNGFIYTTTPIKIYPDSNNLFGVFQFAFYEKIMYNKEWKCVSVVYHKENERYWETTVAEYIMNEELWI